MLKEPAVLAMLGFFACVAMSRLLMERALSRLSAEEKATLVDAFSGQRKYSMLILLGVIGLAVAFPDTLASGIYFLVVSLYVLIALALSFRKLHRLELSSSYIRHYVAGQAIQLAGMIALFAALLNRIRV